jgi:hypothetical protein
MSASRTSQPAEQRPPWGRLPPFMSDFSIATELYSDGLGDVGSQRSAALSESAGWGQASRYRCRG